MPSAYRSNARGWTSTGSRASSTRSRRDCCRAAGTPAYAISSSAPATSIVLNIAEGCGRFARAEKAHFYLIARGSAMECAACFDVAISRGLASAAAYRHGRGLLIRVVQMLTRLARRMQS